MSETLKSVAPTEKLNKSGVHPLGHAVLLKTYELTKGRIELPQSVREALTMAEQRAVVVEIGPMAWFDETNKGAPPRAQVGDKVLFAKHSGYGILGDDGVTYRCVNDRDIFMSVEN